MFTPMATAFQTAKNSRTKACSAEQGQVFEDTPGFNVILSSYQDETPLFGPTRSNSFRQFPGLKCGSHRRFYGFEMFE